MHIVAAKAVAFREALQPDFKTYAAQTVANAKALGEAMQAEGFRIISGGTDTHLILVDVFGHPTSSMLGSEAENALHAAGITVNKNAIPFDTNPPLKPSGVRLRHTCADHARHEVNREMKHHCRMDLRRRWTHRSR